MLDDLNVIVKVVPRIRSVSVRVLPNASIVVTAPPFTPRFVINQFIGKNEDWIREKQSAMVEKLTALVLEREKLFFRGREYDFRLNINAETKSAVKLEGELMIVTSPSEDHGEVRQILESFYRIYAIKYFKSRVPLLADLVDSNVRTVSIRSQRTRWGSCSSRNTISLNWRLIMAPDWVSDYVIYHELAHLTQMNHSKDFWDLVALYHKKHKEAQAWLKAHPEWPASAPVDKP